MSINLENLENIVIRPSILYDTASLGLFYDSYEKKYLVEKLKRESKATDYTGKPFFETYEAFKVILKDGKTGFIVGEYGSMRKMAEKILDIINQVACVFFYTPEENYKNYDFITKVFVKYEGRVM